MKDVLEPFLYPQNLFFIGLFLACVVYKKAGLWLLFLFFYVFGNTWVANQARAWYLAPLQSGLDANFTGDYVVLGCGGNAHSLPDCARNRVLQVARMMNAQQRDAKVTITTAFCEPYTALLTEQSRYANVQCFDGGATTYHEFQSLSKRLLKTQNYLVISSDYHAWRVGHLIKEHGFKAQVFAAPSSTFKPIACGLTCFFTVNLSNFDLWSKLSAEASSLLVYSLTKNWTDWYQPLSDTDAPD